MPQIIDLGRKGLQVYQPANKKWKPTDIPQSEADALVAFWKATDGPNWANYTWDFPETAGAMDGVTVSGGHVTVLVLNGDANISGDCTALVGLTNLTHLYLNSTSVSYTNTMSNWNDGINILYTLGWSATTVDTFLDDLNATGVTDGTLDISGTNAAPTDGSVTGVDGLAALTNLRDVRGWTVTVTT